MSYTLGFSIVWMITLAELGIASISVDRVDVTGTNEGHDRGFAATFTRTDGSAGAAEIITHQNNLANIDDASPACRLRCAKTFRARAAGNWHETIGAPNAP